MNDPAGETEAEFFTYDPLLGFGFEDQTGLEEESEDESGDMESWEDPGDEEERNDPEDEKDENGLNKPGNEEGLDESGDEEGLTNPDDEEWSDPEDEEWIDPEDEAGLYDSEDDEDWDELLREEEWYDPWDENEEGGKSRLIAHTGMAGQAAQNSFLAFELAGQFGYWGIETDLRWSKDHVLLCYHDEKLNEHSTGSGAIADRNWSYIKDCYVYAGNTSYYGAQPVCLFEDYLDICKLYGCDAVIDIKYCPNGYKKMLKAAYDMVVEKDMLEQAVFQCSVVSYLEELRDMDSNARLWLLCGEKGARDGRKIRNARNSLGCEAVCVPVVTERIVNYIHSYDMLCVYYQTDSQKTQKKYFSMGVDLVMENGKNRS